MSRSVPLLSRAHTIVNVWKGRSDMSRIRTGNPVEFTREHRQNYTMGDGLFGIAIEDERADGSVKVEMADGTIYHARHIHAYAWHGWLPEDLEPVYAKYNKDTYECPFDYEDN